MTSFGDSQTGTASDLKLDRLSVGALDDLISPPTQDSSMLVTEFWSTNRRLISDPHYDVMEISFGSKRLVNHFTFDLSYFPLWCWVEYLDANGDWQGVTYIRNASSAVIRNLPEALNPVILGISTSRPAKVDTAAAASTQHFGAGHWSRYDIPVSPVNTSKIRFRLRRNPKGIPPIGPTGKPVPYSLAIRNLQIGYRVLGPADLPTPQPEIDWWASSRDILGSRTVYSTYQQEAPAVIDGDTSTYWRSEPQPFPFAVVNLFLDLRDVNGEAPVVDRFWVDPVTIGPLCNVYYSDSDPVGEFKGLSSPIPDQWKTEVGNPGTTVDAATNVTQSINLGPDTQTGFVASNVYERIHYSQPWWVGADLRSLVGADDTESRPIVSMGTTRIVQENGYLKVIAPTGEVAQVQLDPTLHRENTHFKIVAAYYSGDEATHRDPYLRLVYRLGDRDPEAHEISIPTLQDLSDVPVKIGLHPDPDSTDVAAMAVFGLTIKSESLTPEAEEWFLDEGAEFVADPSSPRLDRGTAQNARLRMHPMFRHSLTNIFGVVGGPGDRFAEMEWTPVTRDYTLRRGYLHLPPKKAKYWKFEMTRLVPQVYENFVTINREALVFPPEVVKNFNRVVGKQDSSKIPSGMRTVGSVSDTLSYADAISRIQNLFSPDAASALIIKDKTLAAQAAKSGWIWTYEPWHVGSSAPQFIGTQVHHYEAIRVEHSTKIAFFAGIREITPYRVDYTFDDDTPEYIEHMLDAAYIDESQTSGVLQSEGSVAATGANAQITSETLRSYRTVRGVQFATQETDAIQVLEDSDFIADDLTRWTKYGDATLQRLGPSDVLINRGWFANTWGALEALYATWGDMDGVLWGALEGNDPSSGYAEGGIISTAYTPTGAGKVTALAQVSATDTLSGPVTVEIISASDSRVLASTEQVVQQGDAATITVSYGNATLVDQSGGEVHRRTWGDLEDSLGQTDIPANGSAAVTAPGGVVGTTPLDDDDDATFATSTSRTGGTVVTNISTVLPAAPSVPDNLTSIKFTVRSSVDISDDVQGLLTLKDTGSGDVINTVHFELNGAAFTQEVTMLAPSTSTGAADLGAAIQAGATVELVIDSFGGALPTDDRTMTVYELSASAGADSTWGDLDGYRWGELEAYVDAVITEILNPDLRVRVRQQGPFRDSFHVHRVSLYESPIAWYFSNDDGISWWQAVDVRNDPYAVMMFPPSPSGDPNAGKMLRWRAKYFREGATVNALHIRPWYGSHERSVQGAHTMEALGPNQSIYDNMPRTDQHPMWTPRFNPIESTFSAPVETIFWRNLVPTPSGEGADSFFEISGGTVEMQADWTYEVADPPPPPEPQTLHSTGDVSTSDPLMLVGSAPQWGDGSDDTYAGGSTGSFLSSAIEPLTDPLSSVTLSLRIALIGPFDPDAVIAEIEVAIASDIFDENPIVHFTDGTFSSDGLFPAVSVPLVDGEIQSISCDLTPEALSTAGVTMSDVMTALQAGAFVAVERVSLSNDAGDLLSLDEFRIYEASVVVSP